VEQERQQERTDDTMARAYAELSEDPEETDVELFLAAQREVVMEETEPQLPPSGHSTDGGSSASPREAET
jgi:hypothetical protein